MNYRYLRQLKVNGRGILTCLLQAKKVNDKNEITEIYIMLMYSMAIDEIN